jgi:hypothetical protein
MEKTYAFIKNDVVENVLVFAAKDDKLAKLITDEKNYDSFVYIGEEDDPIRWSTYDGKSFTPPTQDYLVSIGVVNPIVADEDNPLIVPVENVRENVEE